MANLADLFPDILPQDAKNLQDMYTPYNPKVVPNLNIRSFNGRGTLGGYVNTDDPNTVWLNSNPDAVKRFPQVVPHEMEHVLQNRVSKRYPQNYDMTVLDQYTKNGGSLNKLIPILRSSAGNKDIPRYFNETYKYPIAYYGNLKGGQMSLGEQWAELSAAEQYLKKDLTKDPYVRKHIFADDDALMRVYKGTTGLRTDRWDARDPEPMVADKVAPKPAPEPKNFLERLFGL